MARYAVIENTSNKVVNVIALKPDDQWTPPQGHYVVQSDDAAIGMVYSGGHFAWSQQSGGSSGGGSSGGGGLGVTVGVGIKL